MVGSSVPQLQANQNNANFYDQKIFQHFKTDFTEKDAQNALMEIEESLKEVSKAGLIELKQVSKPHPLVEKTLQIVCALKGFKNLTWQTARELLSRPALKVELRQLTPKTVKVEDIYRAQQILVQKTNLMLTPENVQLHSQSAAFLLVWAANLIKLYAVTQWLGVDVTQDMSAAQRFLNNTGTAEDFHKITLQTKLDLRSKKREEQQRYLEEKQNKMKGRVEQEYTVAQNQDLPKDQQDMQKTEGQSTLESPSKTRNMKTGVIGHFISNKPMVFDSDKNQLVPWNEDLKPKKLVDLNVIRKGVHIPSITDTGVKPQRVYSSNNKDLSRYDHPTSLRNA